MKLWGFIHDHITPLAVTTLDGRGEPVAFNLTRAGKVLALLVG